MSAASYQRVQARMVLDPALARRVAAGEELEEGLSAVEAARLRAQAADPGLALCTTLHEGWRLTKLLTLLPLVFEVGDPDELAGLVREYWTGHRPRGLRFEHEAADFADLVARRAEPGSALRAAALVQARHLRGGRDVTVG